MQWLYSHRKLVTAVLLVLAVLFFAFYPYEMTAAELLEYSPPVPLLAALIVVAFYCIKTIALLIPVAVLHIITGMLFAPGHAVLVAFAGVCLEMSLGYLIGKRMGHEKAQQMMSSDSRAAKFLLFNKKRSGATCFLARVLPVPLDIVSLFFGATMMPFGKYMLLSMLGTSLFLVPAVFSGASITNPLSVDFLLPFGVTILFTLAAIFIYRRLTHGQNIEPSTAGENDDRQAS